MAINIVSLASCPFCDCEAGDIFLDPHAVYDLFDDASHCDLGSNPDTRLIKHNSGDGPCPHLVWMHREVASGREQSGNFKYLAENISTWECPQLREAGEPVRELLLDLAYGFEHEEFLPRAAHDFDSSEVRWQREGDASEHVYQASATTAFAQDIPSFIDGLVVQAARLNAARAEGRNTQREWREIQSQRQGEVEYECPDDRK